MRKLFLAFLLTVCCAALFASYEIKEAKDSAGRVYQHIPGDPFGSRIYTLSNGMKLYLSRNDREPRIQTRIAVRAGSAQDPAESTGLAHYFEHMMFKGNDRIATLDWAKEKPLLDRIEQLFEEHRREQSPEARAEIYKKIDALSSEAAQYSNDEYWLLTKSLGAEGTNAYTSIDETIYLNDIPASELERFLKLESVRFSSIALRRFHTELEAVYEEFNMGQDKDSRLAYQKLMSLLFEGHPYGRHVIGLPEHLKAPSMRDIHKFFRTWYRPDNMALILSGALDYDRTAELAEKYFGALKPQEGEKLPEVKHIELPPIETIRRADITGPQAESLLLGYRIPLTAENERLLTMTGEILKNGFCGLLDKDLIFPQKTLGITSGYIRFRDALVYLFIVRPKAGQTLEELKNLILAEIGKLRKGDFPDWLPRAIVDNARLSMITCAEDRSSAASFFTELFINEYAFDEVLNEPDELEKLTKKQITGFAEKYFRDDNFAIVFKHSGKAGERVHAVKPKITPVAVPSRTSNFASELLSMPKLPDPEPVFPDLEKEISIRSVTPDVTQYVVKNKENERFSLSFVFPVGSLHNGSFPALAFSYANHLGFNGKTLEEVKEAFYRLAGSYSFSSGKFRSSITITGLARNFEELLKLKPESLTPDENAWKEFRADTLKKRENAKKDQFTIFSHACRFMYYNGIDNLSNNYLPEAALNALTGKELTDFLQKVMKEAPLDIVFYGPDGLTLPEDFTSRKMTFKQAVFKAVPPKENQVVLVDYPSVQTIVRVSRIDSDSKPRPYTFASLFDEYGQRRFWSLLREERGLGYSAGAFYSIPEIMPDDYSTSGAYVVAQPDKLIEALNAMLEELDKPSLDPVIFESAKTGLFSSIRNSRVHGESYYGILKDLKRRGLSRMPAEEIYKELPGMTPELFMNETAERISGKVNLIVILGDLEKIDREVLKKYGTVKELKLDEIFRK